MNNVSSPRMVWIDALRLIAGLSMVGLHATSDNLGQPFLHALPEERIAPMFLRAILYMARTELFLMISIFLLLLATQKSQRSYRQTIGLQAQRLLIPFAFWTLFYSLYSLFKANAFGYLPTALDRLQSPEAWLSAIVLGASKYHMHFIPTLFGLILFYPLFKTARRWPVLGLAILLCLLLKRFADLYVFSNYWGHDALPYMARAIKIVSYLGYGMVAAAFLGVWDRSQSGQLPRKAFAAACVIGVILVVFKWDATWQTITTGRWPYDHTAGYWADFLMPVVLFALCMGCATLNWPPRLTQLARYSFGIYLCHPIFLDMAEIILARSTAAPIVIVVSKIAITLPLTCLFVAGLSQSSQFAWTIGLGPLPTFRISASARP